MTPLNGTGILKHFRKQSIHFMFNKLHVMLASSIWISELADILLITMYQMHAAAR